MNIRSLMYENQMLITQGCDLVCSNHIHRQMELIMVTQGSLHMRIRNEDCLVPTGHAVFIESFEPHSLLESEHNFLSIFEFPRELAPLFCEYLLTHRPTRRAVAIPEAAYAYVLSRLPVYGNKCETIAYESIPAQAILMPLFDVFLSSCAFVDGRVGYRDSFLRAIDYITNHMDDNLSLTSVAEAINIKPQSLSRLFSECAAISFSSYVRYLRVCRSAAAMRTGASVTDVVFSTGWGSIRTFNRAFREVTGMTPSVFLRLAPENAALFDWNLTWI